MLSWKLRFSKWFVLPVTIFMVILEWNTLLREYYSKPGGAFCSIGEGELRSRFGGDQGQGKNYNGFCSDITDCLGTDITCNSDEICTTTGQRCLDQVKRPYTITRKAVKSL